MIDIVVLPAVEHRKIEGVIADLAHCVAANSCKLLLAAEARCMDSMSYLVQ